MQFFHFISIQLKKLLLYEFDIHIFGKKDVWSSLQWLFMLRFNLAYKSYYNAEYQKNGSFLFNLLTWWWQIKAVFESLFLVFFMLALYNHVRLCSSVCVERERESTKDFKLLKIDKVRVVAFILNILLICVCKLFLL